MEAEERTETVAAEAAAAPEAAPAQEQGGAVRKRRTRARTGEKAGTVKSRKTRKKAAPESQTAESPAAPAPEEPEIVFPEDGVVNHQEKSPETESAAEALQEPPAAGDEVPADAGADDPEIPFPEEKSGEEAHLPGGDAESAPEAPADGAEGGPVKECRASGRSALERLRAVIRRFLGSPSRVRRKDLPDDDPELMRLRALRRFRGAGREEEKSHEFRSL